MDINKNRFFLAGNIHVGFKTSVFEDGDCGHTLSYLVNETESHSLTQKYCYIENGIVTHVISTKEAKRLIKLTQL